MIKKIFAINIGTEEIHNEKHLINLVKYLFSKSNKHQENNKTKFNYYKIDEVSKFVDNNSFEEVIRTINTKDYSNYKNDLTYIFFLIELDGVLYTNIFDKNKKEIYVKLSTQDLNMLINSNYDDFFFFKSEFNYIFNINDNVVNFDNLKNIKIREEIENIIFKELEENIQLEFDNYNLTISHNDQQDHYHIHRLYN